MANPQSVPFWLRVPKTRSIEEELLALNQVSPSMPEMVADSMPTQAPAQMSAPASDQVAKPAPGTIATAAKGGQRNTVQNAEPEATEPDRSAQADMLRNKLEEIRMARMSEEEKAIQDYSNKISEYENKLTGIDWRPLAGLLDQWAGGRAALNAAEATAPETPAIKRDKLNLMREKLASMKSGMSASQYGAVKDQLDSIIRQNKSEQDPMKAYIEQLRVQKMIADAQEESSKKKDSPITGFRKTSTDAIDDASKRQLRGASAALADFNVKMDSLKQKVSAANPADLANPYSDINKAIQQDVKDLQLAYKNEDFAKLGVLTGPDLKILEQVVENPGSMSNLISGKEGVLQRYDQLKAKVNKSFDNKAKSYGLERQEPLKNNQQNPAKKSNEELLKMTDEEFDAYEKSLGIGG